VTLARPSRIGKYEVDAVIGEGAMGVVYGAVDTTLNRRVAIKVMSDAIAQNAELRQRFLREAQAAGSLQHPNVVTIYDFGEVGGHLYIAMEYVDGEDLKDLLDLQAPLPLEVKLDLIIGVLHGLAFAHKRGVVHRDIKPANIRVDQDGKARIMDFGIAHLASSEMTRTGTLLGTPSYMAPEQIVGGSVSPETDIFSVGAVLYELLTRTRPFRGDTLQAVMYQIVNVAPPPMQQLVPELPAGLDPIVARALRKNPKDRYTGALEMATDLAVIRAEMGRPGVGSSLSLRATIDSAIARRNATGLQSVRSARVIAMAARLLGILVVLGFGYALWGPDRPTQTTGAFPEPPVTASATDQIKAIVAEYARAIESRDTAQLLAIYPGMPAEQRGMFEDFFRSTQSVRARLSVTDLRIDRGAADARLSGSYEYVNSLGGTQQTPVSFEARLHNDGTTWKLVTIH
jgi:predicted Ser/Thr protein kinase